jgi:hypothetical protein
VSKKYPVDPNDIDVSYFGHPHKVGSSAKVYVGFIKTSGVDEKTRTRVAVKIPQPETDARGLHFLENVSTYDLRCFPNCQDILHTCEQVSRSCES